MLDWRRGWGQSAMGICAFCYIWILFGVMVFKRSMLNWQRGCGVNLPWVYVHCAIYIWNLCGVMGFHRSMLNLGSPSTKYVCNGFPKIYAQLEKRVALYYIWNLWGVMVFQRSMLHWRRGCGQSAMGICAFCYIWNLFGVMVFKRSMPNWQRGCGVNLPWVYVHCAIYIWNLCGVMGFHRSMLNLGSPSTKYVCNGFPKIYAQLEKRVALYYIWNLWGVMVFQRSMLHWRRGCGVNLPWVYVHCAIYETYLV